ncbi:MAG: hypothetical protein QOF98_345, partial [Streptomyces sp.]|nr:hypothetical protein [Streptomyces sp.]
LTMSDKFDASGVTSTPTVKVNGKTISVTGLTSAQVQTNIAADLT